MLDLFIEVYATDEPTQEQPTDLDALMASVGYVTRKSQSPAMIRSNGTASTALVSASKVWLNPETGECYSPSEHDRGMHIASFPDITSASEQANSTHITLPYSHLLVPKFGIDFKVPAQARSYDPVTLPIIGVDLVAVNTPTLDHIVKVNAYDPGVVPSAARVTQFSS